MFPPHIIENRVRGGGSSRAPPPHRNISFITCYIIIVIVIVVVVFIIMSGAPDRLFNVRNNFWMGNYEVSVAKRRGERE